MLQNIQWDKKITLYLILYIVSGNIPFLCILEFLPYGKPVWGKKRLNFRVQVHDLIDLIIVEKSAPDQTDGCVHLGNRTYRLLEQTATI